MTIKRIFEVYQEQLGGDSAAGGLIGVLAAGKWRWRCKSVANGQIVSGSQENFDSHGNALRAARHEASLYPDGLAAVVEPEEPPATPSSGADRYILRFDRPGHRQALKEAAARGKRTLNRHILMLIEAGEQSLQRSDK